MAPDFNRTRIREHSRRRRNLRTRDIGTILVFLGITLLVFTTSRAGFTGDEVVLAPPPDPTPTRQSPPAIIFSTPGVELSETPAIPEPTEETAHRAPPPTRLVISAMELDAPIVAVPIVGDTWDVSSLTHEIGHLAGTANAGESSNMVLSAHVTLREGVGPFQRLEWLREGATAVVYAGEEAYTYRVVEKKYVAPDDISVAYPTSNPVLTLLTCTTWDAESRKYSERLAVIARLVEEETPDWTRSRVRPEY
jgi:LPXTG-site transpeptidase (sortase) family protein